MRKSSCRKPREVRAGVPNRRPLGRRALTSPAPEQVTRDQTRYRNCRVWQLGVVPNCPGWTRSWEPCRKLCTGHGRSPACGAGRGRACGIPHQGTCSCCRRWSRSPGPARPGRRPCLCCAGPAESGGCQSPLQREGFGGGRGIGVNAAPARDFSEKGLGLHRGQKHACPWEGGLLQNSFADVLRNCDGRALPVASVHVLPSWPGSDPGHVQGSAPSRHRNLSSPVTMS